MTPSYAMGGHGHTDPDDVWVVEGQHLAILWSGEEYSLNHTWMLIDKDDAIDLQEHR